jgi:hypothetical protein
VLDSRTLRFTPLSGPRVGCVGAKRKRDSKLTMAVDILGHFLAAHVTLITADDQVEVSSCPKPLRLLPVTPRIWPRSVMAREA